MKDILNKYQVVTGLQLIFVFFLPLIQQVSVVSLILLIVLSLFTGQVKQSLGIFKRDKVLWVFAMFYVVHAFGMLYSSNLKYGFFDLQVKLSYLLIPLLISASLIDNNSFRKVKWFFIFGNTLAALICLMLALSSYAKDGLIDHFFYMDYSHFLHTTYFSLYLNLSVIFLLDFWLENLTEKKHIYKWLPLLMLFLTLSIILLFARTALAVSFISIFLFLMLRRKDWIKVKSRITILVCAAVFLLIAQFTAFHFNNRFVQVEEVMKHSSETWNENRLSADTLTAADDNSTSTRIRLWKSALILFKSHSLLGVGTGDIKDDLKAEYTRNSYQYGVEGDLNPHNQYLHTSVMLGVIGLSVLLGYLIWPFLISIRSRNWVYFCFLLIILLNALTESILEVQKGVLLVAYFQVLFYVNSNYTGDKLPSLKSWP